jgi:hypothetical protein
MRQAARIDTLARLIDLYRADRLVAENGDPRLSLNEFGDAADRILEIAELCYILKNDGFPVPQVFERLGWVHTPEPNTLRLVMTWDPLADYLLSHVRLHWPLFLKSGMHRFRTCMAIAELWAELSAQRVKGSSWPHPEMLSKPGRLAMPFLRLDDEDDDQPDDQFFSDKPGAVLTTMVARLPCAAGRDWRRLRARLVPGDELRNYSTGCESFALKMGSSGLALVRGGKAIDHVELIRN